MPGEERSGFALEKPSKYNNKIARWERETMGVSKGKQKKGEAKDEEEGRLSKKRQTETKMEDIVSSRGKERKGKNGAACWKRKWYAILSASFDEKHIIV